MLGWGGVCVEPTHSAFLNLQRLYKDNKKIKCINAGISNKTKVSKINESLFWDNSESSKGLLSTFHLENKSRFVGLDWEESNVILYSYDDFENYYDLENVAFDFINIDVEGHEFIVLNQIKDLLKKCRLLCVEKTENIGSNRIIKDMLDEFDYTIIAETVDNYIAKNNKYKQ